MAGKKKTPAKAPRQRAEDLSARQAAFLREYLISRNATQAAIKAGYSEKTAYSQGQRLLKNVEIKEVVRQEDERALAAARVTQDAIIGELARIGFFDLKNAVTWDADGAELKASDDLDADTSAAIQSIEVKPTDLGKQLKIKAHDKLGALKELAKIARLYPESAPDDEKDDATLDSLMDALAESRKQARGEQ